MIARHMTDVSTIDADPGRFVSITQREGMKRQVCFEVNVRPIQYALSGTVQPTL